MSGAVEGVVLPDRELIYQALRFFFWSAGQGVSPINTDDAPEPEETFWQYGLRTGDEEWETVAERYRASRTTPPARSYADGVEDAAKVADDLASIAERCQLHPQPLVVDTNVAWRRVEDACRDISDAIRLLSQGGKA